MNCRTNDFGDAGAVALAALLTSPPWAELQWLGCGSNGIGPAGCAALAALAAAAAHAGTCVNTWNFIDIRDMYNPTWGVLTQAALTDAFKEVVPVGFELVSGTTKDGTEIKWKQQ